MKKISIVIFIILSNVAFSQTTTTTELNEYPFNVRKENLKIRYFGEVVGPNLNKMDDNQYDYQGNKTGTPTNIYNQVNFQYKILSGTSLLISPRFFAQMGDRTDLKENENQNSVVIDDLQVGLSQQFVRNKKLILNGRLTHRHPFSVASKNSLIRSQIEYQNDFTWLLGPSISIIHWNTYRYYAYESQKNEERYRINFTSIFNYAFNDIWKMQLFHEWDLQHRAPKHGNKKLTKQDWNHFEKYKNQLALGVGYTPIPSITFIPFVKALNDENWSLKTTQLGLWILGKIF